MRREALLNRIARFALLSVALSLAACAPGTITRAVREKDTAPVVDRAAASAASLADYLELLQKLVQSAPAVQAETFMIAQREYELAPTASHQLRFALVLAAPGHAATDLPRAQRLLRELMATPAALLPTERAFAFLELQKVDSQLTLAAENRRLQSNAAARDDRDKLLALNRRLQTETDENARLRKELDEARAKLDAIANIERSLNERKPAPEGRTP
jgi:hypothetical protein